MEIFENFLSKYKKIILNRDILVDKVQLVIKTITSVELENNSITFKNNIIQVKASMGAKGEIFIHKKKILYLLKKELPDYFISDIK